MDPFGLRSGQAVRRFAHAGSSTAPRRLRPFWSLWRHVRSGNTDVRAERSGGAAAQCEQLAILPYREGDDPVYWVFGAESDPFAAGGNDPGLCASVHQTALQALRPGDALSECEPVIVKHVR